MSQLKFHQSNLTPETIKSHEQIDARVIEPETHETVKSESSTESQSSDFNNNWTLDENNLAKMYQVDQLINRKYKKPHLSGTQVKSNPSIPLKQIVELILLFKVSSETDFFRRLQMTDVGRSFCQQIDNCLQTLQTSLEMSPETFQNSINHLTQEYKNHLLSK